MASGRVAAAVAAVAGGGLAAWCLWWKQRPSAPPAPNQQALAALRSCEPVGGVYYNQLDAPLWLRGLFDDRRLRRVLLREWEDTEWRERSGWKGSDLIHNQSGARLVSLHVAAGCSLLVGTGKGVIVHAYFWDGADKRLEGIVSFGPDAESHRGLCHGGTHTPRPSVGPLSCARCNDVLDG